jgi:muramidase (phage lysozyme)
MEKLTSEQLLQIRDNPNVQKFMDIIGTLESGNRYNVITGGETFDDDSKHPDKFGVKTADGVSDAAGRYQFLNTTFQGIVDQNPQAEITDFSPEAQDKAFILLLKGEGVLDDVMQGGQGHTRAIENLGKQFTSLPSSTKFYKQGGAKTYAYLNEKFGVPFPRPPATPGVSKPSKEEILNTDMTIVQQPFMDPAQQPSSYDIAAAITFLSDNQTEAEKNFLSAMSLGAMPKKGKIDPLSKFLKQSAQDETPLEVMVEKQEPRNKVPSMKGVKKFQDGGEVEFKMPRSALVGDDIIEIPESQRKVTLTMDDLENLADAASFVPIPQVKFPAKATKGIMSLLKLDKIDPFLQKGYQDKIQKEYLKDHMDDALGLTYVQNKLEKVFPGFQVKPKKKLKIDLATDELYDPSEPSMGKMRKGFLSKEGLKKDIALSAQAGKGLAKRDIGKEPYILNPMEDYQLSKKDKDFIKNVVRKNYPDFGVKSDASTMRSQAIEQSYDRLLDFVGNKLRRKSMGIGRFYKQKEIDDQFRDTVLNEALKEIDSITKFRDQRKVDSVFSELMKRQRGK